MTVISWNLKDPGKGRGERNEGVWCEEGGCSGTKKVTSKSAPLPQDSDHANKH